MRKKSFFIARTNNFILDGLMTGLGGLDNVALDLEDIQDILDAGNNSRMFLGNK